MVARSVGKESDAEDEEEAGAGDAVGIWRTMTIWGVVVAEEDDEAVALVDDDAESEDDDPDADEDASEDDAVDDDEAVESTVTVETAWLWDDSTAAWILAVGVADVKTAIMASLGLRATWWTKPRTDGGSDMDEDEDERREDLEDGPARLRLGWEWEVVMVGDQPLGGLVVAASPGGWY